jgi:peptide/nickel transport system substrate-binding protein
MASDAGMTALTGERDYDRAKRELRAAGYKGERVAFMVAQDYPILKAASDVVVDVMQRAGMAVDYQALDWGPWALGRGRSPLITDRSEWHSPAAPIFTSTSPRPGRSSSTSAIRSDCVFE